MPWDEPPGKWEEVPKPCWEWAPVPGAVGMEREGPAQLPWRQVGSGGALELPAGSWSMNVWLPRGLALIPRVWGGVQIRSPGARICVHWALELPTWALYPSLEGCL